MKLTFDVKRGFPSGFQYPFLVLRGYVITGKKKGYDGVMREAHEKIVFWIEVDGKVHLFLSKKGLEKKEWENAISNARRPLKYMLKKLREQKIVIEHVNAYTGSGGPSHLLRSGILFQRIDDEEAY